MGIYLGSEKITFDRAVPLREDNSVLDSIIERTISVYDNPLINKIGSYAFAYCSNLTTVNLPQVTTVGRYAFMANDILSSINLPQVTVIGSSAFYNCNSLTSINLSKVKTVGSYAFTYCSALTSINLPKLKTVEFYAFAYCSALTYISLSQVTTIEGFAFRNCYNLLSLYLLGSSIPTLTSETTFSSTPISDYTTSTGGIYGSIYVPASLYSSYLTATNWSLYSARIVSR